VCSRSRSHRSIRGERSTKGRSGVTTRQSVNLARQARQAGADAVIAIPPYVKKASPPEIVEFYSEVARAAKVPVFIENYGAPVGTPMAPRACS
jgi:2-keto-3-deoxy-L-arabinonate dehydratase